MIMCGHFPEGVETFERKSIPENETRGQWYVRQMLGSANISGSDFCISAGNLSQIEHHLFPDPAQQPVRRGRAEGRRRSSRSTTSPTTRRRYRRRSTPPGTRSSVSHCPTPGSRPPRGLPPAAGPSLQDDDRWSQVRRAVQARLEQQADKAA